MHAPPWGGLCLGQAIWSPPQIVWEVTGKGGLESQPRPQVLRALKKPSSPCPCPKTLQICYPRGRGRKPMSSSDIWMPLTSGFREPARAKPIIAPSGTAEPSLDFGACVSRPWPYEAQWVVPVRGLQKHALQVYGLSL